MANVELAWQPNPPEEGVTGYVIYRNATELARTPQTSWVDQNVTPGQYVYEVASFNVWGDGPHSDPAKTPPAASKPSGVILSIKVTVQA